MVSWLPEPLPPPKLICTSSAVALGPLAEGRFNTSSEPWPLGGVGELDPPILITISEMVEGGSVAGGCTMGGPTGGGACVGGPTGPGLPPKYALMKTGGTGPPWLSGCPNVLARAANACCAPARSPD